MDGVGVRDGMGKQDRNHPCAPRAPQHTAAASPVLLQHEQHHAEDLEHEHGRGHLMHGETEQSADETWMTDYREGGGRWMTVEREEKEEGMCIQHGGGNGKETSNARSKRMTSTTGSGIAG